MDVRGGRRRIQSIATALVAAVVVGVLGAPVGAQSEEPLPQVFTSPFTLEGFASSSSVNKGGTVNLHIRSNDAAITSVDITILRRGWAGGAGGEFITAFNGVAVAGRPTPAPDPASGIVDASSVWPATQAVPTGANWKSGVYMAIVTPANSASTTAYIPFVVRDDSSSSKILYVLPTATWQARNAWGGKSLFDFNSTNDGGPEVTQLNLEPGTQTRATRVSFNRPYDSNQGQGPFPATDEPMVRFLEREGYDVTFATSEDLEANPSLMNNHAMFMTTWNDANYSDNMRARLVAARAAGKGIAFFAGNSIYQKIRWENGNRTVVAFKSFAADTVPDAQKTMLWRDSPGPNDPEIKLLGSMFNNDLGTTGPWVVTSSTHWVYQGTGLRDGDQIPGLVGPHFDSYDGFAPLGAPAGVVKLSSSPAVGSGFNTAQQATAYEFGTSKVFNAATNSWPLFVDGALADGRVQRMTRNVLFQLGGGGSPGAAPGYWMLGSDGAVFAFGGAGNFGNPSLAGASAVDLEPTPLLDGYWVVDEVGRVFAMGAARADLGNADLTAEQLFLGERVTSVSSTPSGNGYWLFTTRGRVVAKGDAQHFGDVSALPLNGPVLDSIPTPTGLGYFMVASDGGIFAFGDAVFRGSMGGTVLNAPVQSLVPTATNLGYWLVASDGGIFAFGDAVFKGSMGNTVLNRPVTGMVRYGDGYLMVGEDGGIFNFSSLDFLGSLGNSPPPNPIVSVAAQGT
jgi:hypothetical protein